MTGKDWNKIAFELVSILKGIKDIQALQNQMGDKAVLTQASNIELGRTIELQLLEQSDSEIQLAAYSDGPLGSVGLTVRYTTSGMEVLFGPTLFLNGVPVNDIEI